MAIIHGTENIDNLTGTRSNDVMHGAAGNDTLYGGYGNDLVSGDAGNDRLLGAQGNDTLIGGDGADILIGGDGADIFTFDRADGHDRIKDYQQGVDHLEFRGISGREIAWTAMEGGVVVRYGGLAGQAIDHGEIFIAGITALGYSDFIFS